MSQIASKPPTQRQPVECDNRVQYRPTRRGMVSRARIGGPHDCQSIDNLKIARDTLDSVREIWE
jgi:hypothetical protein